ncbi:MAG TPA: hypothetical protein VN428_05770 [Bryobacteraceae bacterium]|nr:hypothetical protein [Bryobacteraceae bacterium]
MLPRLLTLFFAAFLCVSAHGQNRQERGKKLIDEVVAALGGDRFFAMEDRVESGRAYSFFREELSGLSLATVYTRYLKDPAPGTVGLAERQSFGKEERSGAALFLPDKGYEITFRGARPYPEERFERWRDSTLQNILYILRMRLNEPGLLFDAVGADILDNLPVEIVEVTDAENRTVKVWIDRRTKLPVRQVYYRRDPKTKERFEEVTIFSKYRDVGEGVQWPYNLQRLRDGQQIFQMYADTVQINQSLKDELFTLSPKTKVLKPLK